MNITVGIGAMLLGGWVLTAPSNVNNLPPLEPMEQYYQAEAPAPSQAAPAENPTPHSGRSLRQPTLGSMPGNEPGLPYPPNAGQPLPNGQQQPGATAQATSAGAGRMNLPLPPTAPSSAEGQGPGTSEQAFGSGGLQMPVAPTAPPPSAQGSPASGGAMPPMSMPAASRPSFGGASPTAPKAFSTYNPFASGVSPYMNLFRPNSLGTVDNYTTLVRPALEQRTANQRYNMDIFGLERRAAHSAGGAPADGDGTADIAGSRHAAVLHELRRILRQPSIDRSRPFLSRRTGCQPVLL